MAERPNSTHLPPQISCDFCREKKYKCSKDRPSCSKCLAAGRGCHYSPPQVRSPLTRNHLTSVENRVKQLESLIHTLHPELDIDQALASAEIDAKPVAQFEDTKHVQQGNGDNVQHEALPLAATGFEWQEVNPLIDELADGMASLSIEVSNKGYLGITSGAGLLRSLLSQNAGGNLPSGYVSQGRPSQLFPSSQPIMNFQLEEQLLNHQIIAYLIDGYFTNYHTTYPFIHEPSFRAAHSELLPRPAQPIWQILFYTVLTLGAWTIGGDQEVFDDWCYHKVVENFQQQSIFELGSLPLVQALTLLSNYVQKRNKPNTGSNYLGLAVRQSLSLGLHRELSGWKIGLLEREMRRRIWWGLYMFDSGASTTFGRHILLPEDDDVHPVTNIEDELLTPSTTTLPSESRNATIYSSLIWQCKFHRLTNAMSNRLLSIKPPQATETLQMYKSIQAFSDSMPEHMKVHIAPIIHADWHLFARSRLAWRIWNFELLAMRPFILRWAKTSQRETRHSVETADDIICRQLCISCAHATIDSINEYVAVTLPLPRLHAWYALFFLFHATLVPMLCLRASPDSLDASTWIQDVNTAKFILESSFTDYALAHRCLAVINQLLPTGDSTTARDWSPTQLDMNFTDTGFESWFSYPSASSGLMDTSSGPFEFNSNDPIFNLR